MSKNTEAADKAIQEILSSLAGLNRHVGHGNDVSKQSLAALQRIAKEVDEIEAEEVE